MAKLKIGDYVLATKWRDGDPGDPWAVGIYGGIVHGAHLVNDTQGKPIRCFRHASRISHELGQWLLTNAAALEASPGCLLNLWRIARRRPVTVERTPL